MIFVQNPSVPCWGLGSAPVSLEFFSGLFWISVTVWEREGRLGCIEDNEVSESGSGIRVLFLE